MPDLARLAAQIEIAAGHVTPYWPLRSFIAANPLQGLEEQGFESAARTGAALFGGRTWPAPAMLKAALSDGRIDSTVLADAAARAGVPQAARPAALEVPAQPAGDPPPSAVNRVMIRWLAAFLDEGQAAWPMPGRDRGFWRAFRDVARHDRDIPRRGDLQSLPDDALKAVQALLEGVAERERTVLLTRHLAALAGWAGHVKWRAGEGAHPWAKAAPVTMADFLAVRLFLARQFAEAPSAPPAPAAPDAAAIWLEAWEETWRGRLTRALATRVPAPAPAPAAQLVFCIDVRSEVLRRHLEATGPWATLGFAGFFGAPVAVQPFGEDRAHASCPVLLRPKHTIPEVAAPGEEAAGAARLAGLARLKGAKAGLRALKESVAGAFGFVEATGAAFGAAMVARTVAPAGFGRTVARLADRAAPAARTTHRIALACDDATGEATGLSPAEQAFFAEGALRIMGLTEGFAKLVLLCGHGGRATNNPFAAGLDCGACGGNPGGPNARIMAAVLNDAGVRATLAGRGIAIPAETVFLAAEHNTTTDALAIADEAPAAPHAAVLARLKADLATARRAAAAERLARMAPGTTADPVAAVEARAADWAEVRPEWALARNAGFIVADRGFTRGLDLEGRCFLHSYDWRADATGSSLEVILTAPMVVAEWINTQYYFSTVDNGVFGAGSKVTHNVVGGFGVMQGNASDLMTGLPLQSVAAAEGVPYHEPLRLMTVVQAPLLRVEEVIARHAILRTLFDNGWVALMVADPETGRFLRRGRDGSWTAVAEAARHPAPRLIAA
ncbi:DUF2309 domain-containing protein [Falsiroseomonas sp. CW058]|uniref:DUF2309 domain-containing protein n=1 Tax=Falsiroseomonas sp. CW058 TaxID=3388664 RepID=UPI003D311172